MVFTVSILFLVGTLPIIAYQLPISAVNGNENAAFVVNSLFFKMIPIYLIISIPLLIISLFTFIYAAMQHNENRVKSTYYFIKGMDWVMRGLYIVFLATGSFLLYGSLAWTNNLMFANIIMSLGLVLNLYCFYYYRKKGILRFLKVDLMTTFDKKLAQLIKRIWPYLGVLALISFALAPATRDLRARFYAAIAPYTMVLLIPYTYIYLVNIKQYEYNTYLMFEFPEEYRNALGESEVDFYGKNYMKSKSVMRKIEAYKQSKNN